MHRRRFLASLGLTATAGAFGLHAIQPHRATLPFNRNDNDQLPRSPETAKRVLVIGGGLAGIAAAHDLAERGFTVTLVERSGELGGRLTGWKVNVKGETMATEHGFHGFFNQYYNLDHLLTDAGIQGNFTPAATYPILFKDQPTETFSDVTRIFPFNMLAAVVEAKSVSIIDFNNPTGKLYELMRYDPQRTFQRYDSSDFKTFCQRINGPMVKAILEPFANTTLNRFSHFSTAEAIRFFHFYFMGNPDGLGYKMTNDDAMTSVVTPLTQRLQTLGVTLMTSTEVDHLIEHDGRITGMIVRRPGEYLATGHSIDTTEIGTDWTAVRDDASNLYYVKRTAKDEFEAVSGRCTHMGCPVAPDRTTQGFACPCHGAQYDAHGTPTAGPTHIPLARIATKRDGRQLNIIANSDGTELNADYVVLACDVPGIQQLVARSRLNEPEFVASVQRLGVADPYIVWRLWLDRQLPQQQAPFFTVSGYRYMDAMAIYSQLQTEYITWAERHQGSVVELHAYAVEPENLLPESDIKAAMRAELDEMIPELAGAGVVHEIYTMQQNFPRWAPGDHAGRPGVATPVPNLMLAGDYLRLDVPANLMEAATMTGRMAANQILAAEQLQENPIPTVDLTGPLTL